MPSASTFPSTQLPSLQGVEIANENTKIAEEITRTAEEYETLRIAVKDLVMQEWFSRHKSRKQIASNGRQKIYVFAKKDVNPRYDNTCPYCLNKNTCCWEHEEFFEKFNLMQLADEEVSRRIGAPPDNY